MASIRKLMASLEWSGVANIDMRFDETTGKACILEVNPRFWGSLLGSLSVGVNFPELVCHTAPGRECPKIEYTLGRFIVHIRSALRHLPRLLFWRREQSSPPVSSMISYFAADPLPELVKTGRRLRRFLPGPRKTDA